MKRVLFLANKYMGYEQKIYQELLRQGYEVDMFDERSVESSLAKAAFKLIPSFFFRHTHAYYEKIISQIRGNKYDIVLIIKCDMPSPTVLNELKEAFPNAKFCLYLWDSTKNIYQIEDKIRYFDVVNTFDRRDSERLNIGFRPLFYCKQYEWNVLNNEHVYDLCFVGTIHSDRYRVLKEIDQQARNIGKKIYLYMYLQKKYVYYVYKIIKKEFRNSHISQFSFHMKPAEEISEIIAKSKAIIDIQHPRQTGLTMRTIEMIGMKKKIITTNNDIVNYDFYCPNNVLIIDRDKPKIDADFLENPYSVLPDDIYRKYDIENWLKCVIDEW